MSIEATPLKYMGTQSQETVNMAAALALAAEQKRERDQAIDELADTIGDAESAIGAAASRALQKAKDGLRSAADYTARRAKAGVATYTRDDPVRAVLIAAAVGAVLMGLVARSVRKGARAVDRAVRR